MTRSVTIVSQWYPPEPAPFGRMMHELARFLSKRGWNVTVVTGFPNHPSGILHDGYRRRWLLEENVDGVRVCRVWLSLSPKRTLLGRIATFVTFTATSSWRLLRQRRPGIIFAVLQPLSMGIVLPFVARFKRAAVVFNVQDLHPEAQVRSGLIKNTHVIRFLRAVEAYAYRRCEALTVICEEFRRHAIARGAASDRITVVENWIDTERIRPLAAARKAFRSALGLDDGDFVALYAGTLGYSSGAAVVIDAANLLRQEVKCRFLIVGDGPILAGLKQRAAELSLTNVVFLPFQPESELAAMQGSSDVSIVTLSGSFSEISVPSKLLAYFAAGRAVVASVPPTSKTAELVTRASAGVVVPPADGTALAAAIRTLAADAASVRRFGLAARAFAEQHFSLSAAAGRYESVFADLCRDR
jgi:colanic acid biosynthesis glycosyl transferase WcaI